MAYVCAELVENVCTTWVLYEPLHQTLAITPSQAGEISLAIMGLLVLGWIFGELGSFLKSMSKWVGKNMNLQRIERDKRNNKLATALIVGAAVLGPSTASHAEAVMDTSNLVTQINDTKPEMVNVGTAMIGLVIVAVLFMMIRRVLR